MSDTSTLDTTAPRLKSKYNDEVRASLKQDLGLSNPMQIPRLEKIVINMGVGRATQQPSLLEGAVADLTKISGQKPIVTKAKDSIAAFKLREGQSIGCKVTLRGDRMWEFLDRLISVAIPRMRDFRGLPAHSWDSRGNYTFGLSDQTVFPEIDYDKIDSTRGMDITIVTSAATNEQGRRCSTPSGSRSSGAMKLRRLPGSRSVVALSAAARAQASLRRRSRGTDMAKKSLINKANATPKFKVRGYTRCNKCGRPHAAVSYTHLTLPTILRV